MLQRARAIENGCFVFAPAQWGEHAEGRETYGHSLIVDPWGEVLADAGEGVGFVTAEIDPRRSPRPAGWCRRCAMIALFRLREWRARRSPPSSAGILSHLRERERWHRFRRCDALYDGRLRSFDDALFEGDDCECRGEGFEQLAGP